MKMPLACAKTSRTLLGTLLAIPLAVTLLFAGGCTSRRDFASDPVKWSFAGGDGTWDDQSRRWTFSLSAGEAKSVTIRLSNTSSQPIWVAVVGVGPPDFIGLSDDGPLMLPSSNLVDVPGAGSTEFTFGATAYNDAPKAPHRHVVDFGYSFNTGRPSLPVVPGNYP